MGSLCCSGGSRIILAVTRCQDSIFYFIQKIGLQKNGIFGFISTERDTRELAVNTRRRPIVSFCYARPFPAPSSLYHTVSIDCISNLPPLIMSSNTPITVSVTTQHPIAHVDRRIFSGFVEHKGRCVYGGLVPTTFPEMSTKDVCVPGTQLHQDVIDMFREVKPPLVRYPGGNWTANLNWLGGVEPGRKPRLELAWHNVEPNTFGTNEFGLVRSGRGEAVHVLQHGHGQPARSAGLCRVLEQRRRHVLCQPAAQPQHRQAAQDHLWCLGNEVYGDWRLAQSSGNLGVVAGALARQ